MAAEEPNREIAQRIVAMSVDPLLQSRINVLAAKANEGQMSESERAEYASYVESLDLLGVLKAKARQRLAEDR
jgi:hypothetical protein